MGLIVLSLILSIVGACLLWMLFGEQFPRGDSLKWPATNNILIYALLLVVPMYALMFAVFNLLQD
ncbi:MAG: hypothetical protein CMQ29_06905 [Gammaproteobacteria bacterium]|jgi:hypothetical protein|nr:hypothetical protein [Gammaproteobacteria bacterium]|tara:strand:- start:161 stop:355 length:195 start_codon:yes stop_codon:yes gene_type:complete